MGRVLACLVALFLISDAAHAETKAEKIHQIVQLSNSSEMADQLMAVMWPKLIDLLVKANPQLPKNAIEEFKIVGLEEFKNVQPEVSAQTERVYELNFSDDEVDALLAFSSSPAGRSINAKMPLILQQTMALNQSIYADAGKRMVTRVIEGLKRKGYEVKT